MVTNNTAINVLQQHKTKNAQERFKKKKKGHFRVCTKQRYNMPSEIKNSKTKMTL